MQHAIRINHAGAKSYLPSGTAVITPEVFHRIARTFAEGDYEVNRDSIAFIARDEVFSIRLRTSEGALHVIENDVAMPVARWLAIRLARLPLLADRIIQYSDKEEHFIKPSADVNLCSEHPDFVDDEIECKDATEALHSLLNWEPASTSAVTYVTSAMLDAGAIALITYQGQGSQARYRLGKPLAEINDALSKAQGNYSAFLGYVSGSLKP